MYRACNSICLFYSIAQSDQSETIRRIDFSTGLVTPVAGKAAGAGFADGVGTDARFNRAGGIAMDSGGTVALVVRTGMQQRGVLVSAVLLDYACITLIPLGLNVRSSCPAILQADTLNNALRRVDLTSGASGAVTTVAGSPSHSIGHSDGSGSQASFNSPYGVAMNHDGSMAIVVRRRESRLCSIRACLLDALR